MLRNTHRWLTNVLGDYCDQVEPPVEAIARSMPGNCATSEKQFCTLRETTAAS